MKLIVGLGNPGTGYADTYHNVGFIAVDAIAARLSAGDFCLKQNALVTDVRVNDEKILIAKPQTYMNLSGDAVAYLSRYYKIAVCDILILYDDIDIKKGTVRARPNGSAGTHNGLRDIVAKLGSTDFPRIRIGTGFKPDFMDLADYVLSHIQAFERPLILKSIDAACDMAIDFINGKPWQDMTVRVTV